MQTQTDSDLIAAYAHSGDQNSFAELVARHQRMVYRVCLRMLRHHQEAEDATQAVFLVMLHKANGLTRKGELTGWLYGVARNVALEALRKLARRQEEAMLDETKAIAVESSGDHEAALQALDDALAGLSGVLRQAVALRYLQGYDQAEAARQAGCSMGTLASRASRGIERLRQRLAKRGVALSGVALAGLFTSEASAAVPEALLPSILATVKTAVATTATATATSFMGKLRAKTGLATLDLPTEAQWEYACRVGTTHALNSGYNLTDKNDDARMAAVGRYHSATSDWSIGTATVGSYLPNDWGLYDMHGNVWERCLDWWEPYFAGSSTQDPGGPASDGCPTAWHEVGVGRTTRPTAVRRVATTTTRTKRAASRASAPP